MISGISAHFRSRNDTAAYHLLFLADVKLVFLLRKLGLDRFSSVRKPQEPDNS